MALVGALAALAIVSLVVWYTRSPETSAMLTASLEADPASVESGANTTLSWSTSNAAEVRLEPLGVVSSSGTRQVVPAEDTTYRLVASNVAGETVERTVRVSVRADLPAETPDPPLVTTSEPATGVPAPTVAISARPASVTRGQTTVLSWDTSDATSVRLEPGGTSLAFRGELDVRPDADTTYRVIATNGTGSAEDSVRIRVTELPAPPPAPRPTANLEASVTSVVPGQQVTLSWDTSNATDVSLDPGPGSVAAAGSMTVSPTVDTTYRLVARNSTTSAEDTVRVSVTAPPPAPRPTATLRADPPILTSGGTTRLSWSTSNAVSVRLEGVGFVQAVDSLEVMPARTTAYRIIATNADDVSVEATVNVQVTAAAPAAPTNLEVIP